jgi:hypothetical protein
MVGQGGPPNGPVGVVVACGDALDEGWGFDGCVGETGVGETGVGETGVGDGTTGLWAFGDGALGLVSDGFAVPGS